MAHPAGGPRPTYTTSRDANTHSPPLRPLLSAYVEIVVRVPPSCPVAEHMPHRVLAALSDSAVPSPAGAAAATVGDPEAQDEAHRFADDALRHLRAPGAAVAELDRELDDAATG